MATVNIYLTFNGNCEEAFTFYQSVFGTEYTHFGRFSDMPANQIDEFSLNKNDSDRIMHVALPVSKETCLMGSDTTAEWQDQFKQGNNFSISINTENKAEADRLFQALSEEGQVTMPINTTFWGAYFGMFIDKFGISWMVNYDEVPHQ